jgi:WD40 repeat protein
LTVLELSTGDNQILTVPVGDTSSSINAIAISQSGWVAAGRDDGTILIWESLAEDSSPRMIGRPMSSATDPSNSETPRRPITTLSFDPSSGVLAAGDGSGTIWLWDIFERQERGSLKQGAHAITSLAFDPNGTLLAAADQSGRVLVWDVGRQAMTETLPITHLKSASSVAFI